MQEVVGDRSCIAPRALRGLRARGLHQGITAALPAVAITTPLGALSAMNALTLSPALASLLLQAQVRKRSFLQPFYERFNKVFVALLTGTCRSPGSWCARRSGALSWCSWWADSRC